MDHTKPAQWFRMYAEFATDPKVQMLSEADQRRYLMLLCLRCSNGDVTLHETEVAFQLRITDAEWAATKANLVTRKLVTNDNKPTAWEKRQKASDSSAARVAKHRALRKQSSNGDVTLQQRPVEKEKEKEKEQNKTPAPKSARFDPQWLPTPIGLKQEKWVEWVLYRSKVGKKPKQETWEKQIEFLSGCIAKGINPADLIDESIRNGWQGLFEPKAQQGASNFLTAQQRRDENNRRSTEQFLSEDLPPINTIDGEFRHA